MELKVLHIILEGDSQDLWDRRWSDLQHSGKLEADPGCLEPQFLVFSVRDHRSKRASAWMEGSLPAVAVAVGVMDEN
jgi:hypothetical protein